MAPWRWGHDRALRNGRARLSSASTGGTTAIGLDMKLTSGRGGDGSHSDGLTLIGLRRLVVLAVTVTGVLLALAVLPQWLIVITPRWLIRGASIAFLWTLLVGFLAAAPAVVVCGVWSLWGAIGAYRRRDGVLFSRNARRMLLASSCFLGLIMLELGSAARLRLLARLPTLPTRFASRHVVH